MKFAVMKTTRTSSIVTESVPESVPCLAQCQGLPLLGEVDEVHVVEGLDCLQLWVGVQHLLPPLLLPSTFVREVVSQLLD